MAGRLLLSADGGFAVTPAFIEKHANSGGSNETAPDGEALPGQTIVFFSADRSGEQVLRAAHDSCMHLLAVLARPLAADMCTCARRALPQRLARRRRLRPRSRLLRPFRASPTTSPACLSRRALASRWRGTC